MSVYMFMVSYILLRKLDVNNVYVNPALLIIIELKNTKLCIIKIKANVF